MRNSEGFHITEEVRGRRTSRNEIWVWSWTEMVVVMVEMGVVMVEMGVVIDRDGCGHGRDGCGHR